MGRRENSQLYYILILSVNQKDSHWHLELKIVKDVRNDYIYHERDDSHCIQVTSSKYHVTCLI